MSTLRRSIIHGGRAETDMKIIKRQLINQYLDLPLALFTLILKLRKFRDLLISPGIELHNTVSL